MLRHCPIPGFATAGPRRKTPKAATASAAPLEMAPVGPSLELADLAEAGKEPLPQHKVLKIFSINIIAQGLPFCRRRAEPVRLVPRPDADGPQQELVTLKTMC
ncbi:F-box/WD repeat-containing protein 7 isoform X1 [Arapaima gigas]